MSRWPSTKARRVLSALLRMGWSIKRERGSHRVLQREGWPDYVFAFHDNEEIGPRMLARISRHTGLTPEDLYPTYGDGRDVAPRGGERRELVARRTG